MPAADLSALTAEVTNEETVMDSAATFIAGLAAKLADAKNDPVAIQALVDGLKQHGDALTAAIVANTPAA